MGFPLGMQLATVAFGIPLTATGKDVVTTVTVKPTARVIWSATGQPVPEFSDSFTALAGQLGTFQVPFVNQTGFIDSTGATFTDWAYQITAEWRFGSERLTWSKNFKPLVGQTGTIDLDLVPEGPVSIPVTAPTAAVLGFHGRTGFITIQESDLPARLSDTSLSATYALKGEAGGVGLSAQNIVGATTLSVTPGYTYELTATAAADVTLTGDLGTQVALVITNGGYAVTVEGGSALGNGTYVAHRRTLGWAVFPVGTPAAAPAAPAAPAPTITATTTTTATASWPAVSGATGYKVRVNGGTATDVGSVLTYQATGLASGTAGTIEVQAYNSAGSSTWTSAGFTTATPTPVVIKLTTNDATVTETGNATDGYNYSFAATPYQKGAYSALSLPANTDGFFEYTVAGMSTGAEHPIAYFNANANDTTANDTTWAGLKIVAADMKYEPRVTPAAPVSAVVAVNGDRIRIGRTGLTLYIRYSRDAGATWTDLKQQAYGTAPQLRMSVHGNVYTGQINNVRAVNFS